MNDLDDAIQEFENEAYHHNLHPEISDKAKAVALAAMLEKQAVLRAGLHKELLLEICRAAGHIHDELFCPICGDGLDLELIDGELSIGCFGCEKYIPLAELAKAYLKNQQNTKEKNE